MNSLVTTFVFHVRISLSEKRPRQKLQLFPLQPQSTIRTVNIEYELIKQKFLDRLYKEEVLNEKMKKVGERENLLINEGKKQQKLPSSITRYKTLPKISKTVNKEQKILKRDAEFDEEFQTKPFIAVKRRKNLQNIIGDNKIKQGKVFKKSLH